ncbi:MAG: hypothetical protein FJ221_14910 [Lentisphaerae bacterium]|nr:hypothetical protein [Lentisphaerota bacterium]
MNRTAEIDARPADMTGRAVMNHDGRLVRGTSGEFAKGVRPARLRLLKGSIRGVFPRIVHGPTAG